MKHLCTVLLVILASGCTSAAALKASESDGKICKLEKTTGSNIATRVCRTPEQIAYLSQIHLMHDDFYETNKALSEYLLFHYGKPDEVLPWGFGPSNSLNYPVRCITECIDTKQIPNNIVFL